MTKPSKILDCQQTSSFCRDIPLDEYNAWAVDYERAKSALVDRSAQVDAAAEHIERNLLLLGATAIEDKLQEVRK